MKQLHKQASVNQRRDEEIPSNLASTYSPKALKHPRSLPRSINYLFKEQRLLFILVGILIGSTFFILQPTLYRLGPSDPNNPTTSISRSFSTAHDLVPKPTHAKVGRVPVGLGKRRLRIVVTGGAGFVGSHLVDKLLDRGNDVIVIDNFFTGRKDNLVHHFGNPRFELIRHDVVEPILLEVDQIYHLACPASPVHYKYNPVKTIKTNVMGTLNMLGLAKRIGARFLLTSTSEVYGDPLEHPQKETYWGNVNPIGERSCYDEGKRTAETLAMDYHRGADVEVRIARIFNTYGPRMCLDDGRVVSNFVAQAIRRQPLTVYGDGKQTRSFQYVSDLVNGLVALMDGEHVGPFNLGNPGEFTMLELAEVCLFLLTIILMFSSNPLPKMEQPTSSSKHRSVSLVGLFAAADKVDFVLMLFGSVGACIHGAVLPVFFVLFGRMIDSLGHLAKHPQQLSSRVSQHALYLVYLGLILFASAWIGVAFWMRTGERQTARLRLKYLQSVLKQDINFFDTEARDTNIIFHISSDAILVQDAIGDKTGHALRYLSQFIVGFGIGFTSVWRLTLLTLAVVPLIAIAGGAYTIIMSTLSEKGEAAYAEAGKVAEEVISQIRTVYSFGGEDRAIEAYSNSLNKALKLGKKGGFAKGVGVGFTYGLLFCAWALLLWYAGILVRHHDTNGGKAFTTIINVIFSGFALGQAAPNLAAIAKGRAAAANIMKMIETGSNSSKVSDNGIVLPKVSGQIDFCEVGFGYPSRPNRVLENLSFSIGAGKTFAVVGPSGSGKSTIISMIQRFYNPISGKILLDGHDVGILQLKWLREQMGLVNQEPALFATTIAGNILFGKEDADMDQIIEAAKAANAHSFIQGLPDGYYTQAGEGGTQLSGGQKQRIAIARAVLRNPKILLLDEATSALDAESEQIVQQALDKIMSHRTTIIVAHRLSTIRDVDTIIVLKNGQVVESGNHSELISKKGEYANLVSLQVLERVKDSKLTSGHSSRDSSFRETTNNYQQEAKPITTRQQNPSSAPTASIWELIKLNAPEWPYAILGSVGAVLAGMEAPLFALLITDILTAFYAPTGSQIKQEVKKVALIFVGVAVATVPIYLLQHYFYTLMGERLTTRVRLLMFTAMLSNEVGWFDLDENNTGALTSILAANATLVRSALADRLSTIVQNLALTATAFVIAFTLSWRIAAVVIASLPLLIGASIAEQLFLKGFGGDYNRAYSKATAVAREAIANIRTVAAFGCEERIAMQFASELNQPNKQAVIRGHISGFCYGLSQFFAFCSYALGLWYASILIKHKDSNFGDIMKSFMVLIITALSIAETLALTPDIVKGSQALGPIFRILKRETAINLNAPKSNVVADVKGDIEFRNVSFWYPARPDITIFDNLNLRVSAGKSLAVVGPSGSGKSSVIALVMRFYDPISGTVVIDGYDIKSLNLKSLRKKISLVQQEPALFSTTVYENIKYGNEEASDVEVITAAKAANADGFISRMPEGYKTQVGEKGVQLSGGQKQRVAIARAILKDPSILLLDEATSALDTESEKLVQEALDKLMEGRTTILVAHRLSTIRDANRIALLQNGRVVEMGSHEQLIGRPGSLYKQLVSLQQENSGGIH